MSETGSKAVKQVRTRQINAVLGVIKTWIETESGPTMATFSQPDLKLKIKLRGYKKIILERTFDCAPQEKK
jgi:hypothetical protein